MYCELKTSTLPAPQTACQPHLFLQHHWQQITAALDVNTLCVCTPCAAARLPQEAEEDHISLPLLQQGHSPRSDGQHRPLSDVCSVDERRTSFCSSDEEGMCVSHTVCSLLVSRVYLPRALCWLGQLAMG